MLIEIIRTRKEKTSIARDVMFSFFIIQKRKQRRGEEVERRREREDEVGEVKKGKEGKRKKMRREESVLVHITVSERPGALHCEQSAEVQKVLPLICYSPSNAACGLASTE